jgi:SAM-dependent methyltransferase
MPYPTATPSSKHDLVLRLVDCPEYHSIAAVSQALQQQLLAPTSQQDVDDDDKVVIYSYPDSPMPPLSRELTVMGLVDIVTARALIGGQYSAHSCSVAVKPDKNGSLQRPQDIRNSQAFAGFVHSIKDRQAAILSTDKYQRFGLLMAEPDGETFAATVYVFREKDIRSASSAHAGGGVSRKRPAVTTTSRGDNDDADNTWKSSEDSGGSLFWQQSSGGDEAGGLFGGTGGGGDDDDDDAFWNQQANGGNNNDTTMNGGANGDGGGGKDDDNGFHRDKGAALADKFYSGLGRKLETRASSRIFHMRAFNGWVKATQIQELSYRSSAIRVLDLACGKGGDLGKWILHPIGNYVGVDVARGSLVDAAVRARKMRKKMKRCTFTCADLGSDVPGRPKSAKHRHLQKLSTWSLQNESPNIDTDPVFEMVRGGGIEPADTFDVVSIQFAIHYMMQTKKRARRFFHTVSQLLETGGHLIATTIDARVILAHLMDMQIYFPDITEPATIVVGKGACRIRFEPDVLRKIFAFGGTIKEGELDENLFGLEYTFTLIEGSDHAAGVGDAVNLPEWLIPIPVLKELGREAGLEIEYAQNFHEFFDKRSNPDQHPETHKAMYNMKVLNRSGSISEDEYEISRLYCAIKFRKVRESILSMEEDEQIENDVDELDPVLKAKLYPMALLKAKKNPRWDSLSSEEKSALTDDELRKLAQSKK